MIKQTQQRPYKQSASRASIRIQAPAKINLCLDILSSYPSGYHEIRTVFHELPNLADELEIYKSKEPDHTSGPFPAAGEGTQGLTKQAPEGRRSSPAEGLLISQKDNLAHKALKLLKKDQNITTNAKIIIHKRIPIASGLGGASSDAAAVLKGLNELWGLNLSTDALLNLASQLGADVPFFILGGTALGEHYGEKLTPLKYINCIKFEIDKPKKRSKTLGYPKVINDSSNMSKTAKMYASLDLSLCGKNTEKTKLLLEGIENEDPQLITKNLHNDFETITPPPKNYHLTGSGPSTFQAI
ncbi:MAG: hypothetical protein GWP15_04055 [Nitrospirae bacterium]|nr:hypothetical protein [Nitrospirota bacterium]